MKFQRFYLVMDYINDRGIRKMRRSSPRLKKCNPYDYLSASARVRMLSNKVITKNKLLQMIHASNLRQAFQILNTVDIGVGVDPEDYEQALTHELEKTYDLVRELTDGLALFDIFRYKYDGQNIKLVLKSKTVGSDSLQWMTDLGTVRKEAVIEGVKNNDIPELPFEISIAAAEAKLKLASYRDPQKADIIIDKAVLGSMCRVANEYDNAFFKKVVYSRIDIENIRSLIRAKHAGKNISFFENLLCTGGYIEIEKLVGIFSANIRNIAAFIRSTRYGYVLAGGLGDLDLGAPLTHFEKICDNYLLSFVNEANSFVFGIEPILGYLLEKENEITSIRMVMAAKMANNPSNSVIERLRAYAW